MPLARPPGCFLRYPSIPLPIAPLSSAPLRLRASAIFLTTATVPFVFAAGSKIVGGSTIRERVERHRLALALGLVVAATALAGCLQDLERRQLEATWTPDVRVDEAPYREVRGAPAMVVAQGPVDVPADVNVTVTSLQGELTRRNASIELQPMRVHTAEGTQQAREAEGELSLSAGETLTVTFVPADDAPHRASPDRVWNASLEVQWRFREAEAFDAGRFEVETNLTPVPVPELGVGVVERAEGEVEGLVFEAIDVGELPDQVTVEVLRLGGGSVETLDEVEASLVRSDGTARANLADNITVSQGGGYLLFRLDGVDGTATTDLRASEDAAPFPAIGALAALAGTAWVAARRR